MLRRGRVGIFALVGALALLTATIGPQHAGAVIFKGRMAQDGRVLLDFDARGKLRRIEVYWHERGCGREGKPDLLTSRWADPMEAIKRRRGPPLGDGILRGE
jgi:hypothetical protein